MLCTHVRTHNICTTHTYIHMCMPAQHEEAVEVRKGKRDSGACVTLMDYFWKGSKWRILFWCMLTLSSHVSGGSGK
jgi:hypothetical protein